MKKAILGAILLLLAGIASYFLWAGGRVGAPAAGKEEAGKADKANQKADKVMYHCPMHPTIIQEGPGTCPICAMDLVPMKQGSHGTAGAHEHGGPGMLGVLGPNPSGVGKGIRIDPTVVQNMGVRIDTVRRRDLSREVRTTGRIDVDETRQYIVNAKIGGWVERLHADFTGKTVRKGQPLLEIYSPELVATQEEYLQALRYARSLAKGLSPEAEKNAWDLVESAKRRLRYWDIPDKAIKALEKAGQVRKTMTLYAPSGGVIMEKKVVAGQNIMPGMELFRIADLSRVWVLADLYQADLAYVRKGQDAEVNVSYLPGTRFQGKVAFINPVLEGQAKTAQVRVELPNTPDYDLKPEMVATVEFFSPVEENAVVVPEQSVIRSGKRNIAIVALGDGYFEPREVQLGASGQGYLQIKQGLREGERIVTSSQFLIDSESNLKAAIQSLSQAPAPDSMLEGDSAHAAPVEMGPSYYCPMHPEVTSDEPGAACAKCGGMELVPRESAEAGR